MNLFPQNPGREAFFNLANVIKKADDSHLHPVLLKNRDAVAAGF